MVRPFLRARATIITALFGAFLAPATQAADMPFPVEEQAPLEGPVEWGSNWYLRGDFSVAQVSPTNINGVTLSNNFPNGWAIGLGGGYKFNNWFRADVTVDYQSLYSFSGLRTDVMLPCITGLYQPDPFNPGVVAGTYAGCTPNVKNRTESMLTLANAYLDLGNWYGFTPYIGGGIGVNVLYQRATTNWYMNNGVPYAGVTYSDPRNGATYMENWDSKYQSTNLRFAYALMGGVAYDIDNHWKIDVGYRYVNMGKIEGYRVTPTIYTFSQNLTNHQVRVGLRYMID